MKYLVLILGFAVVLSLITFLQLGSNFELYDNIKLLQVEPERIDVWILSRGFVTGNPHFVPQNVTAKIGTLIVWTNGDLVNHTVTSDEGIRGSLEGQIFDSGPIAPRTEFLLYTSRLLNDVYPYHCTIHPWARGMVTLVAEPISVTTDKSVYRMGEKVTISGIAGIPTTIPEVSPTIPKKIVNATVVKSVLLEVFTPENDLFLSKQVSTLSGGKYSYTFTVGETGVYTVKASINSFTASTTFKVEQALGAKVTTGPIQFADERGMSIGTARVGQDILIRTSIKNTLQTSQDYSYIVQVKDADHVTVLLAWKNGSITSLGLSTPAVAWIPESEGTYDVEAFVWNDIDVPEPLSKNVERATITVRK